MDRIILHCDLDCFFAAVEARDNPKYQGKPLIIGANPENGRGRGVISTCSYEARKYGLHSAMPISRAFNLCPNGIYLRPNFSKYGKVSEQVMKILKSYSDIFQQTSIDEAYMDLTEFCSDYKEAKKIAEDIQKEISDKLEITCSVGIAKTKTMAKIASDYNKPNGVTVVEPNFSKLFLKDLDITRIPGIGKKTKFYFNKKGVKKIGDFFKIGQDQLIKMFGKRGTWIWNVITGQENRPVMESHSRKSLGKERTFLQDKTDRKKVIENLLNLNKKTHQKLREKGFYYRTITLKIRFKDFSTYTRSKSFLTHIRDEKVAMDMILKLFGEFFKDKRKIRLVGLQFSNLEKKISQKQITLLQCIPNLM
ncbi:MAG: DNA polymerase IV [Promethearchaeota archaeon]